MGNDFNHFPHIFLMTYGDFLSDLIASLLIENVKLRTAVSPIYFF